MLSGILLQRLHLKLSPVSKPCCQYLEYTEYSLGRGVSISSPKRCILIKTLTLSDGEIT